MQYSYHDNEVVVSKQGTFASDLDSIVTILSYERMGTKFYGRMQGGKGNKL